MTTITSRAPLLAMILLSRAVIADPLTLERAVQLTLSDNFDLRVAAQDTQTAAAGKREAEAAQAPRLALEYSALASDNPLDNFAALLNTRKVTAEDFDPGFLNDPGTSTLFGGGVVLEYPLYYGQRFAARIESAERTEASSQWRLKRARQLAVFNTIQAYYAAQSAERGFRIATDAERAAQQHVNTTTRLVREDRTVRSDQLTAEVNLATFRSLREQTAGRLRRALSKLKLAMGAPQTLDFTVPPLLLSQQPPLVANVSVHEDLALGQRPDLKSLRETASAAAAGIDLAEAAHDLRVDLRLSTTWYEDNPLVDQNSWRVMGTLSKDLYTGQRMRSAVDRAQSQATALELQIEANRQRILGEVRDAHDRVQEAVARLGIAAGNVAIARRNVKLVEDRYGQGRAILIELLGAERGLVEARNEELAAVNAMLTGITALRLADGSLDPARPETYRGLQP